MVGGRGYLAGDLSGLCGGLETASKGGSLGEGQSMLYQPTLRPDQIHALYLLKQQQRRPMTKLLREAVDQFLAAQSELLDESKEGEETTKRSKA